MHDTAEAVAKKGEIGKRGISGARTDAEGGMSQWDLNCGPGARQIHLKTSPWFSLKQFAPNTPTARVEQVKIPAHWSGSRTFSAGAEAKE